MKLPKHGSLTDQAESPSLRPPSEVNLQVKDLVRRVNEAISTRNRLPQPMFWSLFGHAIRDIREQKERERLLQTLLDSID